MSRETLAIGAALTVLTGLSWTYLYHDATVGHCSRMGLAGTANDFIMLLVMWTVMMAAMMLPSAAPMILMFANVNRQRVARAATALPTSYFVLAYLLIWTAFSLTATAIQFCLSAAALLTPMSMELVSKPAAAALLVIAGIFQWTSLKRACLQHCHTPFTFLMKYWRDGRSGAFAMGLQHGLHCLGCCWAIMALLFVAGVMNLVWVLALSILVLMEKLMPRLARPAGVAMVAAGVALLIAS
jgi:predicted metal-binding membrane protein